MLEIVVAKAMVPQCIFCSVNSYVPCDLWIFIRNKQRETIIATYKYVIAVRFLRTWFLILFPFCSLECCHYLRFHNLALLFNFCCLIYWTQFAIETDASGRRQEDSFDVRETSLPRKQSNARSFLYRVRVYLRAKILAFYFSIDIQNGLSIVKNIVC